ncbi:MAG: HAMP domain-containing sensor histidine kinase, partial [Polyangiaceae bacterium]
VGLPIFIGIVALWGASGAIARRLTRPLAQVARVAEDIGKGKLDSRIHVSRHHRGEVRILADVINDMAARIEKQLADQRGLLATVSHEIRTPLARIRLHAEFARQKSGDSKALDDIDHEVIDIDTLVSDLLASSRIDFTALTRRKLDATEVAQQAVERVGIDPSKLVVEAPHVAFEGDPTLVIRAVTNLLENALRHGGGVELFRVSTRGKFVTFEVEDAGEGFGKGEEERVFEPFYQRPKTGEAAAQSVGLGLTLVKRIAEAHGGRAYAANRAEGGARVGVELVKI